MPESMQVTIEEGNNSTESSLFRDSVSEHEQCPEVDGAPLCGEPTYSLELADGGVPPFDFEIVQGSQGTVEVSTWSNDPNDAGKVYRVVVKATLELPDRSSTMV